MGPSFGRAAGVRGCQSCPKQLPPLPASPRTPLPSHPITKHTGGALPPLCAGVLRRHFVGRSISSLQLLEHTGWVLPPTGVRAVGSVRCQWGCLRFGMAAGCREGSCQGDAESLQGEMGP